jgi:hypothetical protein
LSGSSAWTRYQAVASIPSGQTTRLFLYATPGARNTHSTSEYADVSVRSLPVSPPPLDLVSTPAHPRSDALWVLDQSKGIGWHANSGVQPVSVDGMLAGWVTANRARPPAVSYRGQPLIDAGELVAGGTAACGSAFAVVAYTRKRIRRRRAP